MDSPVGPSSTRQVAGKDAKAKFCALHAQKHVCVAVSAHVVYSCLYFFCIFFFIVARFEYFFLQFL